MFLKNYTSEVAISITIGRIEQVLLRCGVKGIMKEYGLDSKVIAITFRVDGPEGPITIRLPVEVEQALDALWLDYADGDKLNKEGTEIEGWTGSRKKKGRKDFAVQAERTAWKITQDWVEVQMSMIQLKQADLLQVFLPYVYDGKQTYYQALKASNYAGLLMAKT